MRSARPFDGGLAVAVFIDFENIGLSLPSRGRFDIDRVLDRLLEKGKVVVKKAYADWSRFPQYAGPLHEAAIELIEIPKRGHTGKNSADIRMCVDALDMAYSRDHIGVFVIVSGDSDFSPLVSKLKELGKHVIGLGLADSTSDLLRDNCDEFIYYDDLVKPKQELPTLPEPVPDSKQKVLGLLMESLTALRRENKEILWSSMIKDTMKRKKPSFNEDYSGFRTFSRLLEEAQAMGLLELEIHKSSGTYVVTRFGAEMESANRVRLPATASAPALPQLQRPAIQAAPTNGAATLQAPVPVAAPQPIPAPVVKSVPPPEAPPIEVPRPAPARPAAVRKPAAPKPRPVETQGADAPRSPAPKPVAPRSPVAKPETPRPPAPIKPPSRAKKPPAGVPSYPPRMEPDNHRDELEGFGAGLDFDD